MKKILITAALPYANGPLHFGHIAGAYLPADAYARYQRLKNNDVLYICGSDEYGVAITLQAEIHQRSPQEHVDLYHQINSDFFKKLQISFDHFSRTTWEGHKEPCLEFFRDLLKNGHIEDKISDQLYSEQEGRFLADRYVLGTCPKCGFEHARGDECPKCGASFEATDLINPRSKLTNSALSIKQTRHWFLRFDHFKEKLAAWLEQKDWKPNVRNFAKNFLEDLRERAITRDSSWGIPVPLEEAEGKVFYVWFDAPIGYISATKHWAESIGSPERWEDFWLDPQTDYVQFIGKDNIPFHALFFPAMQMGQDKPYKIVDKLSANEFYNLEGKAFSKSDCWYIDLDDFFKHYSSDQIRYYIAATAPENSDSEFKWKEFQSHCNTQLLGKYGNLVNRTLLFSKKHFGELLPALPAALEPEDQAFLQKIEEKVQEIAKAFESFRLRQASAQMMELAQLGNVYFDAKKPWQDAKDPSKKERLQATVAACLHCLKALAVVSYPIIPQTAEKLWSYLGMEQKLERFEQALEPFLATKAPEKLELLFQKIADEEIEEQKQKLQGMAEQDTFAALKEPINFADFEKLDLRVASVLDAKRLGKKLLHLELDLGFEKRSVVSGISAFYDPKSILGQKVLLLANLPPRKIMGVESKGMLLTALDQENGQLELPSFASSKPGASLA